MNKCLLEMRELISILNEGSKESYERELIQLKDREHNLSDRLARPGNHKYADQLERIHIHNRIEKLEKMMTYYEWDGVLDDPVATKDEYIDKYKSLVNEIEQLSNSDNPSDRAKAKELFIVLTKVYTGLQRVKISA